MEPTNEQIEEALRVADADRDKNWIGGAWLEKNCQRLLRYLAAAYRSKCVELDEANAALTLGNNQIPKLIQEGLRFRLRAEAAEAQVIQLEQKCIAGDTQLASARAQVEAADGVVLLAVEFRDRGGLQHVWNCASALNHIGKRPCDCGSDGLFQGLVAYRSRYPAKGGASKNKHMDDCGQDGGCNPDCHVLPRKT